MMTASPTLLLLIPAFTVQNRGNTEAEALVRDGVLESHRLTGEEAL
jgi:hypothetical protein